MSGAEAIIDSVKTSQSFIMQRSCLFVDHSILGRNNIQVLLRFCEKKKPELYILQYKSSPQKMQVKHYPFLKSFAK